MKRILLTNHGMKDYAGTERWTCELGDELLRRGYEVHFLTARNRVGRPLVDLMDRSIIKWFDPGEINCPFHLAICNHIPGMSASKDLQIQRRIFVCHSATERICVPLPGADVYVAISDEVAKYVSTQWGFDVHVVHNGVDLDKYHMVRGMGEYPRVLCLCKGVEGVRKVKAATEALGWGFDYAHWQLKPRGDIEQAIMDSDIVVSLGLGAIEGLACGKAVVVFDEREYGEAKADGLLCPNNAARSLWSNYSGRACAFPWTEEDLVSTFCDYSPEVCDWSRQWAEEHHDIRKMATHYLQLGGLE